MPLKPWMIPFLLVLGGVLSDHATTTIGLRMNLSLREINPQYDPLWAVLVFWWALALLTLTISRKRIRNLGTNGLALFSYLGAINNALVIMGVFTGVTI